jgi:5-methylcytosine-specific restriction protein B
VLPILRTLEQLGGSGRPKDVIAKALGNFSNVLSEKELAEIRDNSRLGWTRLDMVRCGLLAGDRGLWRLTPLARFYLDAHKNDPLEPPRPSSSKRSEDSELTEVVSVTETRAYEIPILAITRNGRLLKEEIVSRVYGQVRDRLLPGDTRLMPHTETMVANYRTGRAISNLWRDGRLKNPARGYWEITQKGRDRLKAEEAFFNLAMFQGSSKATVLLSSGSAARSNGTGLNLDTLKAILGPGLYQDMRDHLQLDQAPTPTSPQGLTRNIIFYGPPGTGKTRLAKLLAQALTEEELPGADSRWRLVQFHPSYSYQDFVQGLRPSLESTGLSYIITTGPFMEICTYAEAEPDRFFVLVIDEINRGDPARIFGELVYGLEYRGEEVQLSLEAALRVPPNLIVLGTMNTADRNLAMSDYGLRRRFGFFRVEPDPEVISDLMVGNAELVAGTLEGFNAWLEQALGRDYALGHSYFLNPNYHPFTAATIERIWRLDVQPLMEEYFSGKPEQLAEARSAWKKAINSSAAKLARGD